MGDSTNANNSGNVIGHECKFVFHVPKIEEDKDKRISGRPDIHVIKEIIHYEDGKREKKLRIVENFQRPFWITKPHYQNHKDKKECELIDRTNVFYSSQSDLGKNVAIRLGSKYIGRKHLRDVIDSPYVYGLDINAKTMIKQGYMDKWPRLTSAYEVATLDIEAGVNTGKITIISVAMADKIFTVMTEEYLKDVSKTNLIPNLTHLFKKHIPPTELFKDIDVEYLVVKDEVELITKAIAKLHKWQPDMVAIWNIDYDLPKMIEVLEDNGVRPEDVFCDPRIPYQYRYFKYVEGQKVKKTASGKHTPRSPEDQWHWVDCPASFWWIDAMSGYRYVRVGGKTVPGGFKLSNILNLELEAAYDKLKFKHITESLALDSTGWHIYISAHHPLEYIIYNQWDTLSMLLLDNKTKDLAYNVGILSKNAAFDIFNSGPKKILASLHYEYLKSGKVIGTKPKSYDDLPNLGLDEWIAMLASYRINELYGLRLIKGAPLKHTNVRAHTGDVDQTSGYPSNGQAGNVSKETTVCEVISIDDIPKEQFKLSNLNTMFGSVNTVRYATDMFNAPTLREIKARYELKKVRMQI